MVVDFADIKRIAKTWIDKHLDHGYMCHHDDPVGKLVQDMGQKVIMVDFMPTAERVVEYLYEQLQPQYLEAFGQDIVLSQLQLYETPKNVA